ncbi:MAG: acyltransferase [Ginsengibacter sp.]
MEKNFYVHDTAVVDEGAEIGEGTHIWHFCHVMPGAKIGNNCNLGQNTFVDNNATIGNGVKVQNNVSVYNSVEIEDDVFIGPSVTFTNVINPRSFVDRKNEFRPTKVRKGASIGANATIMCGVEIGEYSMVGAGSVITKNVPANMLVLGNPGRVISKVTKDGIIDENPAKGL